jgi:hypothetical protein
MAERLLVESVLIRGQLIGYRHRVHGFPNRRDRRGHIIRRRFERIKCMLIN